jgi:hypothetical protein
VIGNLILSTLVRCKHGRGSFDAYAAFVRRLCSAGFDATPTDRREITRSIAVSCINIAEFDVIELDGSFRELLSIRQDSFAKQRYAE